MVRYQRAPQAEIDRYLAATPPAGVSFADWFYGLILLEWRGADEDVQTVTNDQVHCLCGARFVFAQNATRARCPGCGCRYEWEPDDRSR